MLKIIIGNKRDSKDNPTARSSIIFNIEKILNFDFFDRVSLMFNSLLDLSIFSPWTIFLSLGLHSSQI